MESGNKLTKRMSILQELRTVTGTMRGLSAVNIRHFENAANAVLEHDNVVDLGFHALAINAGPDVLKARHTTRQPAHLIILFGSDHGLCGRFNERVVEYARAFKFAQTDRSATMLASLLSKSDTSSPNRLLVAGQIAAEICTANGLLPKQSFSLPGVVDSIPELVRSLILEIDLLMHNHPDTQIDVFHNRAIAGDGIDIKHTVLLPINRGKRTVSRSWPTHNLPGITLPTKTLLAALIREHLFVGLYRACAESQAAEHISRLASMQAACRNIDDQITSVGQQLRKHRQAAITNEILDTVAGYESIMGH